MLQVEPSWIHLVVPVQTGVAAVQEGFSFIGIEQEQKYVETARLRIQHAMEHHDSQNRLFGA